MPEGGRRGATGLNSKSLTTCLFCFPIPFCLPRPISLPFFHLPSVCFSLLMYLTYRPSPLQVQPEFTFSHLLPLPHPFPPQWRGTDPFSVQSNPGPSPPPSSLLSLPPPPSWGEGGLPPSPPLLSLSEGGVPGREGGSPHQHVAPGAVSGGAGGGSTWGRGSRRRRRQCPRQPRPGPRQPRGGPLSSGEHGLRESARCAARAQQRDPGSRRAVLGRALRHATPGCPPLPAA